MSGVTIQVCDAPERQSSGRQPRLTDENLQDLLNALNEGRWATDGQPVIRLPKPDKDPEVAKANMKKCDYGKSAAYQRAQSAISLLSDRFKIARKTVTTAVRPVDANDLTKGYLWRIGPKQPKTSSNTAATNSNANAAKKGATAKS